VCAGIVLRVACNCASRPDSDLLASETMVGIIHREEFSIGKFGGLYRPTCLSGGTVYRYQFDGAARLPECFLICIASPYLFRSDRFRIHRPRFQPTCETSLSKLKSVGAAPSTRSEMQMLSGKKFAPSPIIATFRRSLTQPF
jgi:hypothetical protein